MNDAQAPATKEDIAKIVSLIETMDTKIGTMDAKIETMDTKYENEFTKLRSEMQEMKTEIMSHFDIVTENHHNDVMGVFGDRYEHLREVQQKHGRRFNRLEEAAAIT